MGLGQWWRLQELVSRCPWRIICSELDHTSCCHLLYWILKSKQACSWLHLCHPIALVTFIGIPAYHIFQQLRHIKLWKKMPKLNLNFKNREAVDNQNNSINGPTESVSLNQLRKPWLEDLLQPTHSSFWPFAASLVFVGISTNCNYY